MIRRLFILLSFLAFFSLKGYPQNSSNEKLREIVARRKQATVSIQYPGFEEASLLSQEVSIESFKDKKLYLVLSPITVDWFIARNYNFNIEQVSDAKGIVSASGIDQAMEWNSYPTYTQYDSILQSFCTGYPSLCHIDTIGRSVNGKLVLALKISDKAGTDEDEPEVFYSSTIHGDETGGFILMLRLADYLLKEYSKNSRVRNLVDNLEIWINPLANPDGTYTGGNSISNPVRFNAMGEDLNRNFPDPEITSAILQKETRDMVGFMKKHSFVLSANFHSGDEVVNYPWDRWPRLHADDEWFHLISRKYADTVHLNSPSGYMTFLDNGVTNGYKWYSVFGGRQDFVTYELHGREVTIELDNDFITPAAQLGNLWDYNRNSLLGYLENALFGIHGTVKDKETADPVESKIFITGHDKDSSQVISGRLTGSFTRLLAPGLWNLTFSAPGYYNTRINGVAVEEGKQVFLDVKMIRITAGIDTTNPGKPFLYPNPATTEMKAVLPLNIHGNLSIKIINAAGQIVEDYVIDSYPNTPVIISVKRFPSGIYTVAFRNISSGNSCTSRFIVIKK